MERSGNMSSSHNTLKILLELAEPPYEKTLTELSEGVGMGKSGIYKLLQTLMEENFVVRDKRTKTYQLGPVLFRLGNIYSERKGIWEIAKPIMKAISDITDLTVTLGILEGHVPILAYKIDRPGRPSYPMQIGKRFPINAGVIGKSLIANLPLEERETILSEVELQKFSKNSIIDKEVLREEYRIIRERGWATSNSEHANGWYGLAAPVVVGERITACLCLAGEKDLFIQKKKENLVQLLQNSAHEISYRLNLRK